MDLDEVDPALRDAVRRIPRGNAENRVMRAVVRFAVRRLPVRRVPGVDVTTVRYGGLTARLYRPRAQRTHGVLLWIHGGGFLLGDARQDEPMCAGTAADLGMTVLSVNYRFAPEHPFPAPLNDVYAGWSWLQAHAGELGVDGSRVVVGGESAGGGLAAGLVQRLCDEQGERPVAQWLFAPMIDDRTATDASLDEVAHWVWSNADNRFGWTSYLGHPPGAEDVAPYAAPARRADLAGLPQAYISVGSIDLFCAESRRYAERLEDAGVPVAVDVVPGAPHGFENWAHTSAPAVALLSRARGWLRSALADVAPLSE